jgi:N-acetylneuraminic acid mutarotase
MTLAGIRHAAMADFVIARGLPSAAGAASCDDASSTIVRSLMRRIAVIAFCLDALILCGAEAPAQSVCPGDCDADETITSAELGLAIRAAFDPAGAECDAADLDGDGAVTAAELLRIRIAMVAPPVGCGAEIPHSTWITLAPLAGGARQEVGVAALDGRVYVIGGFGATGNGSAAVELYDVASGQWQSAASLPAERNHVGVAALGDRVYVAGGFIGSGFTPAREVYRYDPAQNAWSAVADLPGARGALALAELGGKLYATGGSGASGSVAEHAAYDPASDTWTALAFLPSPRNHLAAVTLGQFIYVIGGRRDGAGTLNTGELDRYDPGTDAWTVLAPMPTARSGHAAAVIEGRIAVMGGEVDAANPPTHVFDAVELYDPGRNTWVGLAPMPIPRHGIGAATVGDLIYVPGGATSAGFGATDHSDALRIDF